MSLPCGQYRKTVVRMRLLFRRYHIICFLIGPQHGTAVFLNIMSVTMVTAIGVGVA